MTTVFHFVAELSILEPLYMLPLVYIFPLTLFSFVDDNYAGQVSRVHTIVRVGEKQPPAFPACILS